MPEINDVLPLETIETQWGNAIRDRTVQRYVDNTERDNLTPFPAIGELAYITSTDQFQIWDGLAWIPFFPTTGGVVTGSIFLHNSFGDRAGSLYAFDSTGRHILMLDTSALGDNSGTRIQMYSDIDPNVPGQLQLIAAENGIRILESSLNPGANPPQIRNLSGTATRPTYSFQSDQNTGIYQAGENVLGMAVGGQEMARFTLHNNSKFQITGPNITAGGVAARLLNDEADRWSVRMQTSSLEYKSNVKTLGVKSAKDILEGLRPIRFTSKIDADIAVGKNPDTPITNTFIGFGTEEVSALMPEANEGANYDLRAIVAALVKVVQGMM